MTTMVIKFEKGTLNAYAPKDFIKRAQIFGTKEFYEWRVVCKEFDQEVKLVAYKREHKEIIANRNLNLVKMSIYSKTRENKVSA